MNQKSKPHILHVIQTLGSGGAERLLVTYLSQPELKNNFRHTVVMTDVFDPHAEISQNFLVNSLEEQGVEVVGLGSPGPRRLFQAIKKIKRLIQQQQIQMVHSHLIWSNIAGRLAGMWAGVPVISSFHNSDYDPQVVASFRAPKWKQNIIRWADGWTARHCDSVSVAVSHYVADHVQKYLGLNPDRIKVIHNPVDLDHLAPTTEDPRRFVRQSLGLNPDSKIIISVGRVTDQKGFIELVRAFDAIAAQAADLYLVIIGAIVDQEYLRQLQSEIDSRNLGNRVILAGPRKDVGTWLAGGDLFVFPTKFEGLGIALAEAMAMGLPSVATHVGPIPELIEHDVTGILVAPDNESELRNAILDLIQNQDKAQRLGANAMRFIRCNFRACDKAREMADLYRKY